MNKRRFYFAGSIILAVTALLWFAASMLIESKFPLPEGLKPEEAAPIWTMRGQFGGMFGALTCVLSAIAIILAIYSTYQEAKELDRKNENDKWAANYNYLLSTRDMMAEKEGILELHGLPSDIFEKVGVTRHQVVYVLIDLEAAELFYLMSGAKKIIPTGYRTHLLAQGLYVKIIKEIILPAKLLGESKFVQFIAQSVNSTGAPATS